MRKQKIWMLLLCVLLLGAVSIPVGAAGRQTKVRSGITYQVLNAKKKTAQVVTSTKKIKKAKIASTVQIGGKKYKVVAIQKNAFKGRKKLKTVTIGKNITKIGTGAFANCKKLKTIKITSNKLKKIGKNAFSGINKKAAFHVPASKYGNYVNLIAQKNRGWKSTMTIKGGKSKAFTGKDDAQETAEDGYTYTVTPLLSPINEYFYVKTDNPDPESFRFVDETSKYSDSSVFTQQNTTYCDVVYENTATHRVKGGYIFYSGTTDGGTVSLQVREEVDYATYKDTANAEKDVEYDASTRKYTYYKWTKDADSKMELDTLYDVPDYLIQTYAGSGTFFEKMTAVQSGFEKICLYSGSYVKGELEKKDGTYWGVSAVTHVDQSFYLFSPYSRKNNKYLFASSLYPFRYDSLGFPSVMATVSKRLDASSSYQWSSSAHYIIEVTYAGETKAYGGAGEGEGQGLTEDKVKYWFHFDGSEGDAYGAGLEQLKQMLTDYAGMDVTDDIPREDALTWKAIADTVGATGSWIKVTGGYAYVYKANDGTKFSADEWGVGYSLYWGGDLGYGSDVWVDGRYIGSGEVFQKGDVFSDHPTSDIMMLNYEIPYLKDCDYDYEYNSDTDKYEVKYSNVELGTKTQNVKFYYNSTSGTWRASDWNLFNTLVSQGVVAQSTLDELELTTEEVNALGVDANSDTDPEHGYIYDQTVLPGTTF